MGPEMASSGTDGSPLAAPGAAGRALRGAEGGGRLGQLAGADVLGDDAPAVAPLAVVVAPVTTLFPSYSKLLKRG
jgi:hypothetical protein